MCKVLVAIVPDHSGREPVPDPELDMLSWAEQTEDAIREWNVTRKRKREKWAEWSTKVKGKKRERCVRVWQWQIKHRLLLGRSHPWITFSSHSSRIMQISEHTLLPTSNSFSFTCSSNTSSRSILRYPKLSIVKTERRHHCYPYKIYLIYFCLLCNIYVLLYQWSMLMISSFNYALHVNFIQKSSSY